MAEMPGSNANTGHPGREDDKNPFDGITYLYIRTHPADNGSEPLAAGLPFWVSPDISIIKPDGVEGGTAVAGDTNQLKIKVTNAGGIDAVDAYVEGFVADPSTAFTPLTATPIGAGFLTISGYSQAVIQFPWNPSPADAGHRCLLARVNLTIPPDGYKNGAIFDVVGDRHVAQRNISVVNLQKMQLKQFSFAFALVNPEQERAVFTLNARQVLADDERQLEWLRGAVGCGFAQFSPVKLRSVRVDVEERIPVRDVSEPEKQEGRPPMGLLGQAVEPKRTRLKSVGMEPGEVRRAVLTVSAASTARPGDLQVVEISQLNERQEVVGGLWIVVQN